MELLSNQVQDELLYHYTSAETVINHILKNQQLKFNILSETNDPIEYQKICSVMISNTEPNDQEFSILHDYESELNHYKEALKVACFCIDNKERLYSGRSILGKGFARSRLWAQYGESHEGICLIINKEKLKKKIEMLKITSIDNFVQYDDWNQHLNEVATINLQKGVNSKVIMEQLNKSLFIKYYDFKDECEYRFMIKTDSKKFELIDIAGCFEGVIIGDRCIESNRNAIMNHCLKNDIPVYYINWFYNGPSVGRYEK